MKVLYVCFGQLVAPSSLDVKGDISYNQVRSGLGAVPCVGEGIWRRRLSTAGGRQLVKVPCLCFGPFAAPSSVLVGVVRGLGGPFHASASSFFASVACQTAVKF